jgi:hypothetical protein
MGNLSLNVLGGSPESVSEWVAVHEALAELARKRSALDGLEGPALLHARRAEVHRHLGFASFAQYVEQLFGYSRRTLDDKLRTAEALEELPELTRSLAEGVVMWSAVRELARVATAETEREWLEAARGRSVHDIERMVSGQARGARPADEPDYGKRRCALRFEVSAETFATFREAMKALRQKSNQALDDDSALLLMAREVLGGPTDEGRSSYQIAVTTCDRCRRGFQDACGDVTELDASIVEMAQCDTQHVGDVASEAPRSLKSDTTPATHAGEDKRATQTIPPVLRRKVMRRDHGRCVVPGCRHSTFVDLHHIEARADGGAHDESNLIVLCSAHHRAVHRGQLCISGNVRSGLVFRRSDGAKYGTTGPALVADACERAFLGLRGMGFGERETRRALDRVRERDDTSGKSTFGAEAILRQALVMLTTPALHR